tara:strand:- start:657 stop:764 length:108 start_codon:yes stop_codon:yes gene_type:complete
MKYKVKLKNIEKLKLFLNKKIENNKIKKSKNGNSI